MDEEQNRINSLAKKLRLQTIDFLIKKDIIDYKGKMPSDEEFVYMTREVFKIKCCTKLLKKLFRDAHEMHEEKGMFPHTVSVSDLEWCIKNRHIGYGCTQAVAQPWLPYKEDHELRKLPAFVEIGAIYRGLIAQGKPILPPCNEEETVGYGPQKLAMELANNLRMEKTA